MPSWQAQGQLYLFTTMFGCCESEDLNVRLYVSKMIKMKLLTKAEIILELAKTEVEGKSFLVVNVADLTHTHTHTYIYIYISTACDI